MTDTVNTDNPTVFDVAPNVADWYYCAIVDRFGEVDYVDGYASGDRPTRKALQEHSRCLHSWVAGMCYVHDEDAESVASVRHVDCEKCGCLYHERDKLPLDILEFTVNATPHGKYADA